MSAELPRMARGRRNRFFEAAECWGSLSHEALLQIHDMDRGRGWIVTELMAGNAAARLPVPGDPADVERLLVRVLKACRHLHDHGFLHAKIRPSKLLFDDNGLVKLADGRGLRIEA